MIGKEKDLEIRSVEIAYSSDTEVVIGAGLEVGELVIHSSIRKATEGMPLEIIQQDKSSMRSEDPTNTLGA